MVQWDFSLIKNRAPRGAGLLCPPDYTFLLPVMRINLQVLADSGGMICSLVEPCLFGDTGIEPRSSIFDQRKIPLHHFTIGFQKQGICADSLLLESNGKMVQWAQIPCFWNPMVKWCNGIFL
jgi:hypothetical protein